MDETVFLNDYSFTFTIPAFKNVYYKTNRRPFGNMIQEYQYDFLETHIQNLRQYVGGMGVFPEIKWVYEEHDDKRLHVHGYVKQTTREAMDSFRHKFYSYPISITEKSYLKISDIQMTKNTINYFVNYMEKNQDKIKFYMRDINRQTDYPPRKTTVLIESNIRPEYLNSLTQHLENETPGDKYAYPFGKQKQKHIVEI